MMQSYISELGSRAVLGKSVLLRGDAGKALVGKAELSNTDVMVMGSRGMGSIKKCADFRLQSAHHDDNYRAIMGSVSDYCVHNAQCPVLIVRKPGN